VIGLGPAVAAEVPAEIAQPQFEVVSLKQVSDSGSQWGGMQSSPGFIQFPRDTLLNLIELAYDVQAKQITNAPAWADSMRYEIVLSPTESTFAGPFHGETRALRMLQSLLADRFKLVFHRERRSLVAATLVVTQGA